MKKYVCPCGYVYDTATGDPDNGAAPTAHCKLQFIG